MRYRLAILLFAVVTACGSGSNRQRVTFRFIHAVPDGTTVDIWVVDRRSKLFENVDFATATKFIGLEPGTYNIQVRKAGDPRTADPLVETGDFVMDEAGSTFTAIFGGLASAPELDPDELRLDVYEHDFTQIDQDYARIRLVHNAPGEPTFDLTVYDDNPLRDPTVDGMYVGLEIYTSSDAAGIEIDAGDPEQLVVQDNATGDALTQFTTGLLPNQGEFFVVFLGSLTVEPRADAAFRILIADKSGGFEIIEQNPRLYIMNTVVDSITATDTYALDASYKVLDQDDMPTGPEATIETNLLYGDLGGDAGPSIQMPPGEYEFTFRVTGDPVVLGSELSGELLAGEQYLVAVGGRQDGTWPFQAQFIRNAFDKTALIDDLDDENRWQVVHQAPDLEAVFFDLWVNNTTVAWPLFPDSIFYGEVTLPPEGSDIGLDPFTLAIVKQDESDRFGLWDIVPEADKYQFVVLMGSIDPQLPVAIPGWDHSPELTFVDTTTQPWTAVAQAPR